MGSLHDFALASGIILATNTIRITVSFFDSFELRGLCFEERFYKPFKYTLKDKKKLKLLRQIIIIFLGSILQGCFITSMTWDNTAAYNNLSHVQGFLKDSSPENSKRLDYLVISYYSRSTWPRESRSYPFAIPCQDGLIPEALAYTGTNRIFVLITSDISPKKIEMIQKEFTPDSAKIGRLILGSKKFVKSKAFMRGESQRGRGKNSTQWLNLVPYWWKQDGGPKKDHTWDSDIRTGLVLDAKCKLLLIPSNMPKKKLDHFTDVTLAAIETPFTVIADVVLCPVLFIGFLINPDVR